MPNPSPIDLIALMRSRPRQVPVVCALVAVNALVFVLMLVYGAGLWHTANTVQLAWGANFGPATQDGQWWRLGTAMFIHFGVLHLLLNMWALWDVGRLVERLLGPLRFALLYLGSGAAGNLLSLVVQGNHAVSGGASGAIFGLYGALLVSLWRERRQVERREFKWLFGGALVFSALVLGMGFVVPGIDNAAHAGGLVAGALGGRLLARPWTVHSPRSGPGAWWAGAFLALAIGVLLARIPPPSYRFTEELRAREAIAQFLIQDQRTSQRWGAILTDGQRQGLSFDAIAGRIDDAVTSSYERSFEQLLAAQPDSAVPSAKALESLQDYANQRVEASREFADDLRSNNPQQIRKALKVRPQP